MKMVYFIRKLVRCFFTSQCPVCYRWQEDDNICFQCFSKFSFLSNACKKCQEPFVVPVANVDVCDKCGDKFFFNTMSCVFVYNTKVKELVLRFKNCNDLALAQLFSSLIYNKNPSVFTSDSLVIPVPLFKKRLVQRGYNQSLVLAKNLAKLSNAECVQSIARVRDTNSQALKTIQERIDNVKGAFSLEKAVKGKKIILVDDVVTTGATVYECAKVLYAGKAKQVDIVAIARRLRKPIK